jgi:hypothetical protein
MYFATRRAAQVKNLRAFVWAAAFTVRRACAALIELTALDGLLYCALDRKMHENL